MNESCFIKSNNAHSHFPLSSPLLSHPLMPIKPHLRHERLILIFSEESEWTKLGCYKTSFGSGLSAKARKAKLTCGKQSGEMPLIE